MDELRALLVFVMFGTAILPDLRERRVPNMHWMPYALVAGVFVAAEAVDAAAHTKSWAYSASFCLMVYLLWRARMFGGADAKGLMVAAWLWPGTPDLLGGRLLPAADVLINASFLMMAVPLLFAVRNAVAGNFAFPAMILGMPMATHQAVQRQVWPLQDVVDGQLVWRFRSRIGTADAWGPLLRARVGTVWVTPKVPFLVALTLGAAAAWRWGNLLLRLSLFATL